MTDNYFCALRNYWYDLFCLSRTIITKKQFNKQAEVLADSVSKSFDVNAAEKKELKTQLLQISLEQFYNDKESKIQE